MSRCVVTFCIALANTEYRDLRAPRASANSRCPGGDSRRPWDFAEVARPPGSLGREVRNAPVPWPSTLFHRWKPAKKDRAGDIHGIQGRPQIGLAVPADTGYKGRPQILGRAGEQRAQG